MWNVVGFILLWMCMTLTMSILEAYKPSADHTTTIKKQDRIYYQCPEGN